jgi:hypothetical protein
MKKLSAIQIFLAHASEDKPQVRQLYQKLQAAGYQPWLDEVDLIPGQKWRDEIPRAIQNSDIFIACLSSQSVSKRGYVQREFRQALNQMAEMPEGEIYLIPLKLDECEIPDLRQAEYGINLRDIQWLNYWQADGWDRLLKAIALKTGDSVMENQVPSSGSQPLKPKTEARETAASNIQYDLRGAHIGNFVPDARGSNVMSGTFQGGTFIGTQINYSPEQTQDLEQTIIELQGLLEELSYHRATETMTEKMSLATEAIKQIEANPNLMQRLFSALQAGGRSAIEQALNHPAASFVMGALEDWQKNR